MTSPPSSFRFQLKCARTCTTIAPVPKAEKSKPDSVSAFREVGAILLIGVGLFLLLPSLVTYDPHDVPASTSTPNDPPSNFLGIAGAWSAWALYFLFGVAAYLIPVLFAGFAIAIWVSRETNLRIKAIWALLALFSAAALLQSNALGGLFGILRKQYELSFVGGFFGKSLVSLLSVMGNGEYVFFTLVYVCSLVLLLGAKPSHLFAAVADLVRARRAKAGAEANDVRRLIEEREKELDRKARELTEEVERRKREIPEPLKGLMPKDPKIEDRSVPAEEPVRERKRAAPTPVATPDEEQVVVKASELAGKDKSEKKEKPQAVPAATTAEVLGQATKPKPMDEMARAEAKADAKTKPTPVPTVPPPKPPPDWSRYKLPPVDMLEFPPISARKSEDVKDDLKLKAQILEVTLREFGIDVQMGDVTKGPTITRYEVHPAPGVKVEKITGLSNNIALAMKAQSVRILPTIAGKGCIGIEVPNQSSTVVYLRDILETQEWKHHKARIPLALGKDVAGNPIIADLTEMPHLLVAGATGSGKTVCINAIIACLLHHASPEQLRFLMVDPKIVEMQVYNGLPHLLVPVVTDTKKVILALRYVINEMEQRYQMFAKVGVRNIASFNGRKRPPKPAAAPSDDGQPKLIEVPRDDERVIPDKLPYIVVIVDELADLMMTAPADAENAIARLAQLSRAVGIHMILATQRPSVDVVTGVIKANFPARIAFQMASKVDSRTILDGNGAEKLLGKGDMLYLPPGSSKLIRAQGVFIQDEEIRRTVEFIKAQAEPHYELTIHEKLQKESVMPSDLAEEEDEELVEQAMEVLRTEQRASVSLLQRRMRIGYTRAARIMDLLEERKIVGPNKGAEPRDILVDLDGQVSKNA